MMSGFAQNCLYCSADFHNRLLYFLKDPRALQKGTAVTWVWPQHLLLDSNKVLLKCLETKAPWATSGTHSGVGCLAEEYQSSPSTAEQKSQRELHGRGGSTHRITPTKPGSKT